MNGESRIGRRELLMGAGAGMGGLALGAIVAPAAASAQSNDQAASGLLGGWLVDVSNPTGPPTKTAVTFAVGGAITSMDISPPSSPQIGTWESRGSNGFEAQFWGSTVDPTTSFVGTIRVHVHGTFTKDGHISGRYSFAIFDSTGTQVATGQGTFSGGRIIP